MISREQKLIEMGLGPVWRLRQAGDATEESKEEPSQAEASPTRTASAAPLRPTVPTAAGLPPGVSAAEREQRILRMDWTELKETVAGCIACNLCKTRRQTVFGTGDEHAEWMLVGEAPGAEEDARGEPFVGQAGLLLDSMLAALSMKRGENVYIANVLKCRPPGNRNPEPGEVARCSPHLLRQLALIKPKLILAMGRFAAQSLLESEASIASMRGRVHRYQGLPVIVTYHPAYLLRNLPDKYKSWQDLVFAKKTMESLKAG